MERYSVKKPFTVLVAVIVIIALGVVSLMHLSMDLLPEISLPYMIVITTYPGAGPEKVEALVTEPMENTLGTLSGVKNISSTSSDNYSMIQLEFEDGTDLDSVMVKLSSALNQLQSSLPDGCGTPSIMQISMDMVATMYIAVEREGYDIYELSDFVDYDVIPYISRQEGVASVNTLGLVEQTVHVELNQDKIDALNDDILATTNEALADAAVQLEDAHTQLDEAQEALESAQSQFGPTLSSALVGPLNTAAQGAADGLRGSASDLIGFLVTLEGQLQTAQATQNASLAQAQANITQLIDLITTAQAAGEAISSEEAQALVQAISDAMSGVSQTDYGPLAQNVVATSIALQEAIATYGPESPEAEAAQANYDTAVLILTTAITNEAGITNEDVANIQAQIEALITALNNASNNLDGSSVGSLITSSGDLTTVLNGINNLLAMVQRIDPAGSLLSAAGSIRNQLTAMSGTIAGLPQMVNGVSTMVSGLTQAQLDAAVMFSTATMQLSDAQAMLDQAQAQYDAAREQALANANADALLTPATLSGLIYAQNFAMPAGYIDDENDNSWLLKIGDEFETSDAIAQMLLIDNEMLGTIRLEDVADIIIIDNAGDSYTKLNGSEAVIITIFKSSVAGTNDVSRACNKALKEMEELYPGMHSVVLMDQGVYISMIVESIFSSIGIGALLAVIILAIFLKDFKPTLVVAISIPLSVLFALVLLYFTGLELNMMTLSGLSLGIGMLVDNSVVVMENILRLRNRGVPAARAAVQGAKQVSGSIIASTLTTICVFLPSVFASGTVKTLLYPLALSIGYCLVASLVMALTVVPASCSTLLSSSKPKEFKFFTMLQNGYGKSLKWCLKFKVVPLLVAFILLAISVVTVLRTGIVYIPEMSSNEINATIYTPEELTREESYAMVDSIINEALKIDGIEELGIMDSSATSGMLTGGAVSSNRYGSYMLYIVADDNISDEEVDRITSELEECITKAGAESSIAGGGLSDMSALGGGSGIAVYVYGQDLDTIHEIATEVGNMLSEQEGLAEIDDGSLSNEPALHLVIDRDLAMSYGFTTAQIYAQVAQSLQTSVTATTVTIDGMEMTVVIDDNTSPITRENILDMEFDSSAAMGGMGAGTTSSAAGFGSGSGFGFGSSDEDEDEEDVNDENDIENENDEPEEEEEATTTVHRLGEFAQLVETEAEGSISRENLTRYVTVTASVESGYNTNLISRELTPKLNKYEASLPNGYSIEIGGETTQVNEMVSQMLQMAALALLFIYVIMVAQFQSLLSPFIILFTIPLAFTGGMFGLMIAHEPLSMLSLLGFVILMGTVVNNGIVFVDYANQLRMGGMERRDALVATGITRMRPILMTALTTILAMSQLIIGKGMASQLGKGMAIVIAGGLIYGTFMTLYIVPIIYDILFKRKPLVVDVGDDIDEEMDDAAEFLKSLKKEEEVAADAKQGAAGKSEGSTQDKKETSEPSAPTGDGKMRPGTALT